MVDGGWAGVVMLLLGAVESLFAFLACQLLLVSVVELQARAPLSGSDRPLCTVTNGQLSWSLEGLPGPVSFPENPGREQDWY